MIIYIFMGVLHKNNVIYLMQQITFLLRMILLNNNERYGNNRRVRCPHRTENKSTVLQSTVLFAVIILYARQELNNMNIKSAL